MLSSHVGLGIFFIVCPPLGCQGFILNRGYSCGHGLPEYGIPPTLVPETQSDESLTNLLDPPFWLSPAQKQGQEHVLGGSRCAILFFPFVLHSENVGHRGCVQCAI